MSTPAAYTELDILNSSRYAEYNTRVRLLQRMHARAPHLTSWLNVRARDATNEDYYVPKALERSSKVLEIEMTKTLCEALSCTPVRQRDVCRPNEPASYYYVGDSAYDVQCQPACFNTATKATYGTDGTRSADTPQLNWHAGKCRIVNSSTVSWLEKTYYRSGTHYEYRLNDMPTGFSRVPDTENPFGSGFTYKPNPTYCGYYDRRMQANGACTMTAWEYVLDSVIGMSLIDTVRSAVRVLTNGNRPFELPEDLPKLPNKLDPRHTLEGWRANVRKDFVVPPVLESKIVPSSSSVGRAKRETVDDNDDGNITRARREAEERELSSPDRLSSFLRRRTVGAAAAANTTTAVVADIAENETRQVVAREGNESEETDSQRWIRQIREILIGILQTITTDPNFWAQIGIDVVVSTAVERLKNVALRVFDKVAATLSRGALRLSGSMGTRVLAAGFRSLIMRSVGALVLRIGAQAAVMLAKLLAAVSSVVGWLLVGAMLLDIGFALWDPFGYKNLFPPEMPRDLMTNGETALRQMLKTGEANYEFDQLTAVLLTEDEMLEVQIESLVDRLVYLDSLVVNSEGTRIEKGPLIDPSGGNGSQLTEAQTQALAERVRFDAQTYAAYNRRFNLRVELANGTNVAALSTLAVSLLLAFVARLTLLALLAFVIGLLLLCAARALSAGGLDAALDLYDRGRDAWLSAVARPGDSYDDRDYSDGAWGVATTVTM